MFAGLAHIFSELAQIFGLARDQNQFETIRAEPKGFWHRESDSIFLISCFIFPKMGKIMNRVFEISHKASGQSQAISNQTQQKEAKKKLRQTIGENGDSFKLPKNSLGKFFLGRWEMMKLIDSDGDLW